MVARNDLLMFILDLRFTREKSGQKQNIRNGNFAEMAWQVILYLVLEVNVKTGSN